MASPRPVVKFARNSPQGRIPGYARRDSVRPRLYTSYNNVIQLVLTITRPMVFEESACDAPRAPAGRGYPPPDVIADEHRCVSSTTRHYLLHDDVACAVRRTVSCVAFVKSANAGSSALSCREKRGHHRHRKQPCVDSTGTTPPPPSPPSPPHEFDRPRSVVVNTGRHAAEAPVNTDSARRHLACDRWRRARADRWPRYWLLVRCRTVSITLFSALSTTICTPGAQGSAERTRDTSLSALPSTDARRKLETRNTGQRRRRD